MKKGNLRKIIASISGSFLLLGGVATYIGIEVADRLKADGTYNYQLMESTDELLNGSHILIAKTDAPDLDGNIKVAGPQYNPSSAINGFKYVDVNVTDGVISTIGTSFVFEIKYVDSKLYIINPNLSSNNYLRLGSTGSGEAKFNSKTSNSYFDITKTSDGYTFKDHTTTISNKNYLSDWTTGGGVNYLANRTTPSYYNIYIDVDRNLDLWASEYLKKGTVETDSYKEEHFIEAEAKLLQMGEKYINRLNKSSTHTETKTLYDKWNSVATKIHSKTYFGIRATKVGESWNISSSEANMMFGGAISKANESDYAKYGVFYSFHDRNFLTNLISVDKSSSTALTSKNIYQYELDLVNVSPVSIECDTKLEWGLNLYDIPSSDYDKQMDAIAYVYTSSSKYLFSNVITKSVKDMANDLISSGTISGNYLEVLNAIVA